MSVKTISKHVETVAQPQKSLLDLMKTLFNYLNAAGIIVSCTLVNLLLFPYLHDSNLMMVYLLGVTIVAVMGRTGPSILASILSILLYDYFFITPFFSFSIAEIQYVFSLIVMLSVSQIISQLTIHVRRHIEVTQIAQQETEKERFRNILLTSVSHDLRTPLTAIMGSASSILHAGSEIPAVEQRELVQNIFDESERLNRLVNNILKIIKLEAGPILLSKQEHVLTDVINDALHKLQKQLTNKVVNLHVPEHLPCLRLDNILIEQVIINLIENAIKFTPDGSPIEMSVTCNAQFAVVTIADRGTGIKDGDADKIFNKFYRGQQPEATGIGLGLGLAICKGIITAHDGKIWAQSRDGGGAIFHFTLPLITNGDEDE